MAWAMCFVYEIPFKSKNTEHLNIELLTFSLNIKGVLFHKGTKVTYQKKKHTKKTNLYIYETIIFQEHLSLSKKYMVTEFFLTPLS